MIHLGCTIKVLLMLFGAAKVPMKNLDAFEDYFGEETPRMTSVNKASMFMDFSRQKCNFWRLRLSYSSSEGLKGIFINPQKFYF